MLHFEIIDLPEIAVIGKEGLCSQEHNIVSQLWNQANSHFSEVAELGMKDENGAYVGFWGAMSDESRSFMPWTENFSRGLYLAGVEANQEAVAPEGWVKWILPARKYLVTEVQPENYAKTFSDVLTDILPGQGLELSGAVCDFTDPSTGKNKLFFPVTLK